MKTTNSDIQSIFDLLCGTLSDHGLIPEGMTPYLQEGQPTYGYAWKLYFRNNETGGLNNSLHLSGDGYLGATKKEAWHSMRLIIDLLGQVPFKN